MNLARFRRSGNKTDRWKIHSSPSPRFTDFRHHLSMRSPEPISPSKNPIYNRLLQILLKYSVIYPPAQQPSLSVSSPSLHILHKTPVTPSILFTRSAPCKINWMRATLGMEGWPRMYMHAYAACKWKWKGRVCSTESHGHRVKNEPQALARPWFRFSRNSADENVSWWSL